MANELIRPIDADTAHAIEETAKGASKAIEAAMQGGRYIGAVLGDLPHDLVGLIGDWVASVRARRWAEFQIETEKILRARGVENREKVSPSVAIPLIAAAINEDRDGLEELCAKWMVAAMDPNRAGRVRLSLVEFLKQLDPLDTCIFQRLTTQSPSVADATDLADALSRLFEVTRDEAFLSLERLHELGGIEESPSRIPSPRVTSRGRLLIRAVSD